MGWADKHIQKLKEGETVQFRPHGKSMEPKIESGQLCTVEPAVADDVQVGDIVLCKVNGRQFLHLVSAKQGKRCRISNNKGHVNGWTTSIYGRCSKVED